MKRSSVFIRHAFQGSSRLQLGHLTARCQCNPGNTASQKSDGGEKKDLSTPKRLKTGQSKSVRSLKRQHQPSTGGAAMKVWIITYESCRDLHQRNENLKLGCSHGQGSCLFLGLLLFLLILTLKALVTRLNRILSGLRFNVASGGTFALNENWNLLERNSKQRHSLRQDSHEMVGWGGGMFSLQNAKAVYNQLWLLQ